MMLTGAEQEARAWPPGCPISRMPTGYVKLRMLRFLLEPACLPVNGMRNIAETGMPAGATAITAVLCVRVFGSRGRSAESAIRMVVLFSGASADRRRDRPGTGGLIRLQHRDQPGAGLAGSDAPFVMDTFCRASTFSQPAADKAARQPGYPGRGELVGSRGQPRPVEPLQQARLALVAGAKFAESSGEHGQVTLPAGERLQVPQ